MYDMWRPNWMSNRNILRTVFQQSFVRMAQCFRTSSPTAPAYISQLMQYFRVCCSHHDFLDRGCRLTRTLLTQWLLVNHHLESFTVLTMTWFQTVTEYLSQMTTNMLFVIITIHKRITNGATRGSGTVYTFPEQLRLPRF